MKELLKRVLARSPRLQQKARCFYLRRIATLNVEPEMAPLKELIKPGSHVLDLGANIGVITCFLAGLVGPEGRVNALEPVAGNYEILRASTARMTNVSTHRLAVGETSGMTRISIPPGGDGFYTAHLGHGNKEDRYENIEVIRLDDLALPRIDFVKCDIEGGELAMLKGATGVIEKWHPSWYMEVAKVTSDDVFAFMHERGYQSFVCENDRLVPTERYLDKRHSNYYFLSSPSQ
jgi:FkbM family methyltransferase